MEERGTQIFPPTKEAHVIAVPVVPYDHVLVKIAGVRSGLSLPRVPRGLENPPDKRATRWRPTC